VSNPAPEIAQFVNYAQTLAGDEKGEAQVFCDRLFKAFGHAGYKEAGATLEYRVRMPGGRTKYADLLWKPRLLLEMKKRGTKLDRHYSQAFDYWVRLVPDRPRYVVLSNFDEFWIYDFNSQVDEPVDTVPLRELPNRYTAFNLLFPVERKPQFRNDLVAVTRAAADKVAQVYKSIVGHGGDFDHAQRFILQCVVALFSEDFDLLPRGLFTELIDECRSGRGNTYDLFGALFNQMNDRTPAGGGRFRNVPYFNGGLFKTVRPIELSGEELDLLSVAASENWGKVNPAIFGTLFQNSMDKKERHAYGAHFTSEADIQKVVRPTIVRPWRAKIEGAKTLKQLLAVRDEMIKSRVLDPACGSGNFLYIAYRELKRLEVDLLKRIHEEFDRSAAQKVGTSSLVSLRQFYGIDSNHFAVELAKVTLMLAKEMALRETKGMLDAAQEDLPIHRDQPLPLDNLDNNIIQADALFCDWPAAETIVGNPPYQSKNKMQQEYGPAYLNRLRARYPDVPGRADYCVYWFRRSHEELPAGGRAGLVGTKTIRENYSREGGLDYIVNNGGTITEAVSVQPWSGSAAVHVSIVNWVKGDAPGPKSLFIQHGTSGDSPVKMVELPHINSSLSAEFDVSSAVPLAANIEADVCSQGQTHGHEGFLLSPGQAANMLKGAGNNSEVIFPYLTADDLLTSRPPQPERFVIDFHPRDIVASGKYEAPFQRVKELVLPTRRAAAEEEEERNALALSENPKAKVNVHHRNFLKRWWILSYAREDLIQKLNDIPRYIVCSRVTKRPIFDFISSRIRPNDSLQVFTLPDDYSFGVLQSDVHWAWFMARCSKLTERLRYTSNTVFDTFPWPQSPTSTQIKRVAAQAVSLRELRRRLMEDYDLSLRELYRSLDLPGQNPLREAQDALNAAVRAAYSLGVEDDPLPFLLDLNDKLAVKEASMQRVVGPGLPTLVKNPEDLITEDCVQHIQ
jgi:type II restriction/modification system DNA methylase subunit YeeA